MFKKYFFFLFFVCFLGCEKENLKIGTFRFYEDGNFIGYVGSVLNWRLENEN